MTLEHATARVRRWSERLGADPLASRVIAGLRDRRNEIWQGTFDLLQRECPEYRNSVDDEFAQESKNHCGELLGFIVAVGTGRTDRLGADPFQFVRTHAAWRARHHVPLTASLHAYRLAHKTYWALSRRSALQAAAREKDTIACLSSLSDFWMELFDHVGAVLAEAHAVEERLILAEGTQTHAALITDLLRGSLPVDGAAQRLSTSCGIRPGAPMAIAVARPRVSIHEKEIDRDATLRSYARLIEQALPSTKFGKLIDIRDGEVVAIACGSEDTARGLLQSMRRSGFGRRATNGVPACVGVSLDTHEIAELPGALEEARLALDFASAARPLLHFSEIDLPEFLIRRADRTAFRLVPAWARNLCGTDDPSRALSRTIRAFAECNFNVKRTAHRLDVHTNTVYFRLNRINKVTGIDPRTYSGTVRLLTALRLLEMQAEAGGDI